MCDKAAYREQGYKPRKPEELWAMSPMNPKNRKKQSNGTEFQEDHIR